MFELMILLVVVIVAWWLITGLAMIVSRGLRRIRLQSQVPVTAEAKEPASRG